MGSDRIIESDCGQEMASYELGFVPHDVLRLLPGRVLFPTLSPMFDHLSAHLVFFFRSSSVVFPAHLLMSHVGRSPFRV